jgi:hypothetical protein
MPTVRAWENFIAEFKLGVEVTTFTIENKCGYFVRIESYHASRHPSKMTICYWRD